MLEKQFKNWVKDAIGSSGETGEILIMKLEHRLDNAVYRSGLAQSRDQARQLVNHGHILVNGKKVSIASCQIKKGDVISVREGSAKSPYFASLVPVWIKNYQPPQWLLLDANALKATVQGTPTALESGVDLGDLHSLIEFYSR